MCVARALNVCCTYENVCCTCIECVLHVHHDNLACIRAHAHVATIIRHSVMVSARKGARRGGAEAQGSQGTQTRGTWDVCITEGCSSIKNQTICIGSVKVITGAFVLQGVLYIKQSSHVPISVSTRMTLA